MFTSFYLSLSTCHDTEQGPVVSGGSQVAESRASAMYMRTQLRRPTLKRVTQTTGITDHIKSLPYHSVSPSFTRITLLDSVMGKPVGTGAQTRTHTRTNPYPSTRGS